MTNQKPRIPMSGGDEHDLLTRMRRILKYAERPGACKAAKRSYNRRLRRAWKNVCMDTH